MNGPSRIFLGLASILLAPAFQSNDQKLPEIGGTLVVCNQQANSAFLIRLRDGLTRKIETGVGPHEAAVAPDGKTAIISNYGDRTTLGDSLLLIDITSGKPLKTIPLGTYTRPHGLAFIDADHAIATSETTKNLVVVDLKEGKVERAMPTESPGSHMLALVPGGKTVFSANIGTGTVTEFDVATGAKKGEAKVGKGSEGIGVSPDGRWVLTANHGEDTVSLVETASMKTVATLEAPGHPYRAAFSPDSKYAYVPNPERGVIHVFEVAGRKESKVVDLAKGGKITLLKGDTPMGAGIFIHPKGRYAFVTVLNANCVAVVDLDKGETIATLPADASPDGVAWSPVERKD